MSSTKFDNILLGNCEDLLTKMEDASIDMVLTDPPYGMNYISGKQNYDTRGKIAKKIDRPQYFKTINNDDKMNVEWLGDAYRILKPNSALYVFCRWTRWGELEQAVKEAGFEVKNMIVVNKSNHGMGDLTGSYAPKHELLLFASKGRHIFNENLRRLPDIWSMPVKFSGAKRLHSNEKPLKWLINPIRYSSPERGVVLDPFMGSGSTLEVAYNLNRRYVGIDNDPHYYQVAVDRIAKRLEEVDIFEADRS